MFTETAIQQNKGLIALLETQLAAQFAKVPARERELTDAAKRAAAALHDFQRFLETELLARSDGSFRLGRERFAKKLAFALGDDIDIDTVAANARALLTQTQAEMVDTAKQIWADDKLGKLPKLDTAEQRKAFVKRVLDHVAADHPTNQTILADAKQWLAKVTAFVREKDLVRVPDSTGGTRTGALGKFVYAAPESLESAEHADQRSDVYSLGMTALFGYHGKRLPHNRL